MSFQDLQKREDERGRRQKALEMKRQIVECKIKEALGDLDDDELVVTVSRFGASLNYSGDAPCKSFLVNSLDTTDDWIPALSEGIFTSFNVDWYHTRYGSYDDIRVLRIGEPIFNFMRARNLHPEWDGTMAGEFSITTVDEEGAKLALAMALHSRLGSSSPLALVSSVALLFCRAEVPTEYIVLKP